jgi:hypothetical protein
VYLPPSLQLALIEVRLAPSARDAAPSGSIWRKRRNPTAAEILDILGLQPGCVGGGEVAAASLPIT